MLALAAASAGALLCCASGDGEDATNDVSSQATSATHRRVSFLVASDLHFGYGNDNAADDDEDGADDDADPELTANAGPRGAIYARNLSLRTAMEDTLGAAGKKALAAHDIQNDFRGLIVTGDIGDDGQPDQFQEFVDLYGIDGKDKTKFPLPVYETTGNHDYPWNHTRHYDHGTDVPDIAQVIDRNKHRDVLMRDEDSGSYAWKWDDVLFVNLGVKASYRETVIPNPDGTVRATNPFGSLAFLKKVLGKEANEKNTPVVLAFHYPMVTSDDRMNSTERKQLYEAIAEYHVIAIIHGHRHRSWRYKWCGIPVLEVDSPRNAATGFDATFLAVDIDDYHLNAQTVRYLRTPQGGLEVRYEDHPDFNPRKKDAKNIFYRVDKMPLADVIEKGCSVEDEEKF